MSALWVGLRMGWCCNRRGACRASAVWVVQHLGRPCKKNKAVLAVTATVSDSTAAIREGVGACSF